MRPVDRPPLARLIVLDDDSDHDGEVFRLRRSVTTIGRRDCDITIGNDPDISSRHAEIQRSQDARGHWYWYLVDLESTNGTYVRVSQWCLRQEVLFRTGAAGWRWNHSPGPPGSRFLYSSVDSQERLSYQFVDSCETSVVLGTAKDNQIVVDDPTVDSRHASFECDRGQWMLRDLASLNGTWIKRERTVLSSRDQFLLGQQRFVIEFAAVLQP